ncbi:hypothetical protein B0H12DRAFT_197724 [Mycena haematopus]|nr:hypothetical protein B0H12DRAFT_197724 [Mycena haematopus]
MTSNAVIWPLTTFFLSNAPCLQLRRQWKSGSVELCGQTAENLRNTYAVRALESFSEAVWPQTTLSTPWRAELLDSACGFGPHFTASHCKLMRTGLSRCTTYP